MFKTICDFTQLFSQSSSRKQQFTPNCWPASLLGKSRRFQDQVGSGICFEVQRRKLSSYGRTNYKTNMQALILITIYRYRWEVNSLIKNYILWILRALPGKDSDREESACNVGHLGSIPGYEDQLEEGIATYSSILAWRIPMD